MIADHQTNAVYTSDLLPRRHPRLTADLRRACRAHQVPLRIVPGTRDIWCRDYMPIQVGIGRFVQFRYRPDYLPGRWAKTITPPEVCRSLPCIRQCVQSDIVLDGGNVVKWTDKVIVTDKVFHENPGRGRQALLDELASLLEVQRVIVIPVEPGDVLGHADGVVRFIDGRTVLVNDYSKVDPSYGRRLRAALRSAGLECVPIPYAPDLSWRPKTKYDIPPATGVYVNFLQTHSLICISTYGLPTDLSAIQSFKTAFTDLEVVCIECGNLAVKGGVLNCVSWTTRCL